MALIHPQINQNGNVGTGPQSSAKSSLIIYYGSTNNNIWNIEIALSRSENLNAKIFRVNI
jgi:hypothetical protein